MPDPGSRTDVGERWLPIETAPEKRKVLTKIDDERGVRNEQVMVRERNLWWIGYGEPNEMYVYYQPTHWKEIPDA